jgi:DNA adenine methylase
MNAMPQAKIKQVEEIVALAPTARPILKWAGGKGQLLQPISRIMPKKFNKYIEPFIGGGALFFSLRPEHSVIADINPELINLYNQVANNLDLVIASLETYENTEECFYATRGLEYNSLPNHVAAARTIYLNKTCFNGLYRVNKKGQFNVPYGKYKNPNIVDHDNLFAVSELLKQATIREGSYLSVLAEHAEPNDLIFLDPPYLPISQYSDFKRYTKEQFYEDDHVDLANEVHRLHELGCHVILTNSNHPLVHELYSRYKIDVIATKRHISCKSGTRTGEDVIVNVPAKKRLNLRLMPELLPSQVNDYPSTRYMGSKNKLLPHIWNVAKQFEFDSVLDLFSGSGVVSYMFKAQGKSVISNDYMHFSSTFAKAMIENSDTRLGHEEALMLFEEAQNNDRFVQTTFKDLYFSDKDNEIIDTVRANIKKIKNKEKQAIALSALVRACFKKRPRGIFTYVGQRYDDGRKDLSMSLREQFLVAVEQINNAVFDNGKPCLVKNMDAMSVKAKADLVYIDPPYYSPLSDNEYVRRYHFVEGIARDWQGVEIQEHTKTKKFKSYPTPFSSRIGAYDAFEKLFKQHKDSILIVSYSSNSLPTLDEMVSIMAKYKKTVEVVPIDYKYSIGNQSHKVDDNNNNVQEYLFVGY